MSMSAINLSCGGSLLLRYNRWTCECQRGFGWGATGRSVQMSLWWSCHILEAYSLQELHRTDTAWAAIDCRLKCIVMVPLLVNRLSFSTCLFSSVHVTALSSNLWRPNGHFCCCFPLTSGPHNLLWVYRGGKQTVITESWGSCIFACSIYSGIPDENREEYHRTGILNDDKVVWAGFENFLHLKKYLALQVLRSTLKMQ